MSLRSGNWHVVSGSLENVRVNALAPSKSKLFAGTENGVWTSNDGDAWQTVGLAGTHVDALLALGDTVLAGTGTEGGSDGLVYRSDDAGTTWAPAVPVPAVVGLPGEPIQTLASGAQGSPVLAGSAGGGIYRSNDGRGGWTHSSAGIASTWITSLWTSGMKGGEVFAGTDDGLYHSVDDGNSWTALQLPSSNLWVQTVAGGNAGPLLGGYDGSVYARDGQGWKELTTGLPSVLSLLQLPTGGVMVGTFDGVFCLACAPSETETWSSPPGTQRNRRGGQSPEGSSHSGADSSRSGKSAAAREGTAMGRNVANKVDQTGNRDGETQSTPSGRASGAHESPSADGGWLGHGLQGITSSPILTTLAGLSLVSLVTLLTIAGIRRYRALRKARA